MEVSRAQGYVSRGAYKDQEGHDPIPRGGMYVSDAKTETGVRALKISGGRCLVNMRLSGLDPQWKYCPACCYREGPAAPVDPIAGIV